MRSFLSAMAPEAFIVFGVKLKRLTFGHVLLLERFDCNPAKDVLDLATSIQICSRDWIEALNYLDNIKSWRVRVRNHLFMRRLEKWPLEEASEAWAEYLRENTHEPELVRVDGQIESDKGAPYLAQMRVFLLGHCGYSPGTINDQPWGQCRWDYLAAQEEMSGSGIIGAKQEKIANILKGLNVKA